MRLRNSIGGFFLSLLFNLMLNFSWSIPAWILLILHFAISLPIIWFLIALGVWLVVVLLSTLMVTFAAKCSNAPKPVRENKNPYSVGQRLDRSAGSGHNAAEESTRREE